MAGGQGEAEKTCVELGESSLTFVALVAEVAIVFLKGPAERVARIGIVGCGSVEDTIHACWAIDQW